jgi:GT2 family glycosyltransferase/putative flippase GtrA
VIFLLGLGMQAALTGHWHVPAFASYMVQAVVSVELSFVLNRWLTWRDRDTALWTAFGRFNAQKAVTVTLNAVIYAGLLRIGLNYLLANVLLTIVFTIVNYAAGDKLVFSPRKARKEEAAVAEPHTIPLPAIRLAGPSVSVVIPCRSNAATIGAAVLSLLDQDYAHLDEIILVGSPDDTTWDGLVGIEDPRLTLIERAAPPGVRDANFKRDVGIKMTSTELVALVDSDIVLPADWLSTAVTTIQESGVGCVAGGMKSIHDSFWGRYTDNTVIGAKTPRIASSYVVTNKNFGTDGHKPPITANALFTRELYDKCAIDPTWSHGSYEDYEWFWRVAEAGFSIMVSRDLFGWHHHRRGLRALIREYRRSARGCAYFIRAHLDCPFARRRRLQAVALPFAALAAAIGLAAAARAGEAMNAAGLVLVLAALLAAQQILRMRRLEAVAYPVVGLALGSVYLANLVSYLILRPRPAAVSGPVPMASGATPVLELPRPGGTRVVRPDWPADESLADESLADESLADETLGDLAIARIPRSRWAAVALAGVCAVQAALSLSFVWSNTAFTDEADYIWTGRLVLANWLHGKPLPNLSALSGSPDVFPPLAAAVNAVGGLAAVRIMSLAFMLVTTIMLYLTATRVTGRIGAVFAAAIFAITEPVVRLAFGTYDPLSIMLTAVAVWLLMLAGERKYRGELVAAGAVVLALANATAFSGLVIDPVVILFAFLVWRPGSGRGCGWLAGRRPPGVPRRGHDRHALLGRRDLHGPGPDCPGPAADLAGSQRHLGLRRPGHHHRDDRGSRRGGRPGPEPAAGHDPRGPHDIPGPGRPADRAHELVAGQAPRVRHVVRGHGRRLRIRDPDQLGTRRAPGCRRRVLRGCPGLPGGDGVAGRLRRVSRLAEWVVLRRRHAARGRGLPRLCRGLGSAARRRVLPARQRAVAALDQ